VVEFCDWALSFFSAKSNCGTFLPLLLVFVKPLILSEKIQIWPGQSSSDSCLTLLERLARTFPHKRLIEAAREAQVPAPLKALGTVLKVAVGLYFLLWSRGVVSSESLSQRRAHSALVKL